MVNDKRKWEKASIYNVRWQSSFWLITNSTFTTNKSLKIGTWQINPVLGEHSCKETLPTSCMNDSSCHWQLRYHVCYMSETRTLSQHTEHRRTCVLGVILKLTLDYFLLCKHWQQVCAPSVQGQQVLIQTQGQCMESIIINDPATRLTLEGWQHPWD